jgi:DNA-binding CsgD family transcriptional regulator
MNTRLCANPECRKPLVRPNESSARFRRRLYCSDACYRHTAVTPTTQRACANPACQAVLVKHPGERPAKFKYRRHCGPVCDRERRRLELAEEKARQRRAENAALAAAEEQHRRAAVVAAPTEMDLRVLLLTAAGLTSTQIGRRVGLTEFQVRNHHRRCRDFLAAKTSAHAVAMAFDRGWLRWGTKTGARVLEVCQPAALASEEVAS